MTDRNDDDDDDETELVYCFVVLSFEFMISRLDHYDDGRHISVGIAWLCRFALRH